VLVRDPCRYSAEYEAMAFAGSSQLQLLLTLQFPDGMVRWGSRILPSELLLRRCTYMYVTDISVNSFLLNLTGIIFAVQFVALLILGAYGDYGKWRPWILISFTAMLYLCQFAISAINKPAQWWGAQVCYVAGIVGESSDQAEVVRGLMYSYEHDGRVFCCYFPGSRAGSARGHSVREGSHGRYPRVSRSAYCDAMY